jgi:presenilin-like A22 family membrane protease
LSGKKSKIILPILGMGLLFVIGISMALALSPIFLQMNARADFSELGDFNEESIAIILIYFVAILIFTGIILLIGKARKGKFLKYIIIGVVGITIVYTFMPIIGYAMHGPLQLIWDENESISEEVTIIKTDDIDNDGKQEIILGNRNGYVYTLDAKTHNEEWRSEKLGTSIKTLDIADIDSNGVLELIVLTSEELNVYRPDSSGNYDLIYTNNSEEISSFTTGDIDSDGLIELYFGTRLGTIVKLDWNSGSSNELLPVPEIELNNDIHSTVTALQFWSPQNTDALFQYQLLIVGRQESMELYYAENGSKLNSPSPGYLGNIRNPIIIEVLDISSGTTDFVNSENKVIIVLTRSKILSILHYNDFSLINLETGVRDFGNAVVADIIDKYDGEELILKGQDQFLILYSKESLWEKTLQSRSLVYKFDPDGKGAAVTNLDDDKEKEILIGTSKGYAYGEYNLIEFSDVPCFAAIIIAVVLIALLVIYPEWYVIDILGIIIGAGVCAIIGISIAILPIVVFLIALAVYDAISVYKTKHMIDLADNVMTMRLPIILIIPKKLKYSFIHQKPLKDQLESKQEREAMFMGLGDLIIPGTLAVSALTFLPSSIVINEITGNFLVAIGTVIGALCGFVILMRYVLKGRPQAGLPLLNSGAILGYFITYFIVFQDLTFGLKSIF